MFSDDSFLDIRETLNSIQFYLECGGCYFCVESELKSIDVKVSKELKKYDKFLPIFNLKGDQEFTEGIKGKLNFLLGVEFRVNQIINKNEII